MRFQEFLCSRKNLSFQQNFLPCRYSKIGRVWTIPYGVVAHERPTEPRVTMELLLAKPRSFSTIPVFLDLNGSIIPIEHF